MNALGTHTKTKHNNACTLLWHHNERNGVSNHQPHDCLLKCLFRRRSKGTSKLHITGLCVGNSPVTGELPAQRASNVENDLLHNCSYYVLYLCLQQCLKLIPKSCRSSCLESQILNIRLKKNQQKVPGPPPKLSASDWRTCGNFQHWLAGMIHHSAFIIQCKFEFN